MDLTDSARARLEAYLAEVRTGLAGRSDVDAEEVAAGIREHIESDLGTAGRSAPVTLAELNAVLARVGAPEDVAGASDAAGGSASAGAPDSRRAPAGGVVALALGFAGAALALAGVWPGVGWLGVVVGAVLARSVVGGSAAPPADSPIGLLLRLYWTAAAVALVAAVVLLPAVVVWSLAQTGGPLSSPAQAAWDGSVGSYWRWVGVVAGMATGVWWLLLGLALRPSADAARRTLGPAAYLAPTRSPRVLLAAGAVILLLSILVMLS